jgi:DNA-binding XRE family transcriptional regulator
VPPANANRAVLGRTLRSIRERKGLTQERVAFLARIHPNYVSDIELGKRNISWDYPLAVGCSTRHGFGDLWGGVRQSLAQPAARRARVSVEKTVWEGVLRLERPASLVRMARSRGSDSGRAPKARGTAIDPLARTTKRLKLSISAPQPS